MGISRVLLKCFTRHRKSPGAVQHPESIRNLLVLELGGLGDAVMLSPFVRELKRARPELRVSVLTSSRAANVLENNPYIDCHYVASNLWSLIRLIPVLRSRGFDAVLNAYTLATDFGALKMATLMSLMGDGLLMGRDQQDRGKFFHLSVPETETDKLHEVERTMAMLPLLGISLPPKPWPLEVFPQPEHAQEARKAVEPYKGRVLVCLHPHAFRPTRRWPLENFMSLGEALAGDDKFVPLFTVARDDPPEITAAIREKGFPIFLSESPLSLAALYDHATCVVVNDTGPMHLAVARSARLVALFGPSETRFLPWGEDSIVLRHPVSCSPCYYFDCPMETHCMTLITLKEAESAVRCRVGEKF
jgi:ADP-heptose:LPS heptosyltransferase